jgi:hypothetical protein
MSDGVTQFVNALNIVNNTGNDLSLPVQANGYKQLISPSWNARNVPNGPVSDGYTVHIPANSTVTLGVGIYRNGDPDQSTQIVFSGAVSGKLAFFKSEFQNGMDINQHVSWEGASNVTAPTAGYWNFNSSSSVVATITINA